jgi:hypothetical protein
VRWGFLTGTDQADDWKHVSVSFSISGGIRREFAR